MTGSRAGCTDAPGPVTAREGPAHDQVWEGDGHRVSTHLPGKVSATDWWLFTQSLGFFLFAWELSLCEKTEAARAHESGSAGCFWKSPFVQPRPPSGISFLFLRAFGRRHPSPQRPTWFSYLRPDEENGFEFPVIQDGLNGQKLHSASKSLSLRRVSKTAMKRKSRLCKGKEKSPWPAHAPGELHKVAFAGFEQIETRRVKLYIKTKPLECPRGPCGSFLRCLLSHPSEILCTPADSRSLRGPKGGTERALFSACTGALDPQWKQLGGPAPVSFLSYNGWHRNPSQHTP